MGKEQGKKGKHLFLHGAFVLAALLLSAGCATSEGIQRKWQGYKHVDQAEKLMEQGKYAEALTHSEEALRLWPEDSPGDIALFHMGLVWAHPNNPQKNYEKALECFERLVHEFPRSTLSEEAGVWIGVTKELICCKGKTRDLQETVSALRKELDVF